MKQVLAVRVGAKKAVGHIVWGGGLQYIQFAHFAWLSGVGISLCTCTGETPEDS